MDESQKLQDEYVLMTYKVAYKFTYIQIYFILQVEPIRSFKRETHRQKKEASQPPLFFPDV